MNPPTATSAALAPGTAVRPAVDDDIAAIVRLLEQARAAGELPLELADMVSDLRDRSSTLVATVGDVVVGAILTRLEGDVGRVVAIVISPEWRHRGVGSGLLERAETQLLRAGARKIVALMSDGQIGATALTNRGFRSTPGLVRFEKTESFEPSSWSVLERWGGERVAPARWHEFSGLRQQREVVEERVLAPLMESELASQFGVVPPSTMLLFGPPGTGKTSFAKALAGRLGWPFVELLPSKLGAEGLAMMADEINRAFDELLSVEHVVVFIDEVDDIASSRAERPDAQAVVNELLKAIVRVREAPGRLLVCATNSIGALDPAVVRPGRFDLVLPVGPPDAASRVALLSGMVDAIPMSEVDSDDLAVETEGLTPADIASVVQRAASEAFAEARNGNAQARLTTARIRRAVNAAVPTISREGLLAFRDETERFSRY